ncbi:MAG: SPFH domain-containing protein [Clostridia bacterium]|nr:SPFH domain-containing protein [Clostridia bacterium]
MGLLSVAKDALAGTLASQWREYYYLDSMPEGVLAAKASRKVRSRLGGTRVEQENTITSGSIINVADGQCMLIVDQGRIVEFCAEPGEFVYDKNTEPSLFYGPFNGEKIKAVLKRTFERFSFGGEAGKDQRVYYFNTKEIVGNKYGTPNPVPFRVVDRNIGLDVDIAIRCFGEYSYRITNPMLFYKNVCGNVAGEYTREKIDAQLKTELLTALQPAFARISEMGLRYSALPAHTQEIAEALNDVLSEKWVNLRGIEIVSFGVSSVTASAEDEAMIKNLQSSATMRDPAMAAAQLAGAQAQAMRDAAKNENGAMMGFMGMGMAQQAGGMNAQSLFQMAQQQPAPAPAAQPAADSWTCACGTVATGKFCPECGKPRPAANGWTCAACGHVNQGKFCSECGAKKPAGVPQYRCDKCGWVPEDPAHPPKFCPECGDPFGDEDKA